MWSIFHLKFGNYLLFCCFLPGAFAAIIYVSTYRHIISIFVDIYEQITILKGNEPILLTWLGESARKK